MFWFKQKGAGCHDAPFPSLRKFKKDFDKDWVSIKAILGRAQLFMALSRYLDLNYVGVANCIDYVTLGDLKATGPNPTLTAGRMTGVVRRPVMYLLEQCAMDWIPIRVIPEPRAYVFTMDSELVFGAPKYIRLYGGTVSELKNCPVRLRSHGVMSGNIWADQARRHPRAGAFSCELSWDDIPSNVQKALMCQCNTVSCTIREKEVFSGDPDKGLAEALDFFPGAPPENLYVSAWDTPMHNLEDGDSIPVQAARAIGFESVRLVGNIPLSDMEEPAALKGPLEPSEPPPPDPAQEPSHCFTEEELASMGIRLPSAGRISCSEPHPAGQPTDEECANGGSK